ncbi:MAG TPA: GatB/YqeY domain-containing protein [Candidatus Paceibacterota bacterium]|jgi:uncharacterized protein YqeY|nr:GatB/YqeY domain-containing protein [Candidatus Paceibacterota bacterium]
MTLHQTIKEQIKDALRAKDTIRLDTLRGLNALALNEMMANNIAGEFLADDKVMALIKRSVKQHKDSIEQFEKGGRTDLVSKEKAELVILESFMPAMMSYDEVKIIVRTRIDALKSQGNFDPKATGKIVGMLIKELAGKADGMMVKKAVDEIVAAK